MAVQESDHVRPYGIEPLTLHDDNLQISPTSGSAEFIGYAVHYQGNRVGTIALHHDSADTASLRWNLRTLSAMDSARAIRLLLEHFFDGGRLSRVEVRLAGDDAHRIRIASMSGLRREGRIRHGQAGTILMGRLAADPSPYSHDGFIAVLNAGLPTKRVISQGILRDEHGRVLLCELTYKSQWDLPGGVVETGESPEAGLVREIAEELNMTVTPQSLHTVNWLPAWRGWDDACVFVFDLGRVNAEAAEAMQLQASEIRAVHWCTHHDVQEQAAAATVELLDALENGPLPHYRESAPRS